MNEVKETAAAATAPLLPRVFVWKVVLYLPQPTEGYFVGSERCSRQSEGTKCTPVSFEVSTMLHIHLFEGKKIDRALGQDVCLLRRHNINQNDEKEFILS